MATEQVLKQNFGYLKDIFISEISQSSYPALGSLDCADFATSCKLLEDPINMSTLDRMFIAATTSAPDSSGIKDADIPGDKMNRFEFLEFLVRLANVKLIEDKKSGIKKFSEATEPLIKDFIMPNYHPEPWQKFRET